MPSRSRPRKGSVARSPRRFRPFVEPLEERWLPSTIKVTTAADDNTPNDGTVSLREAIIAINNGSAGADFDILNQNPGTFGLKDTINFNIPQPASGPVLQTINVNAAPGNGPLPTITGRVVIDGTTEPGYQRFRPAIALDGAAARQGANGLWITAGNSTVAGLVIIRFPAAGIRLDGGGNNVVIGNIIGTDPIDSRGEGNGEGVLITNGSSGNKVGQSRLSGLDNFISGNKGYGVEIAGTNTRANVVTGNDIGGFGGNAKDGVYIHDGATNNVIGGASFRDANGNLSGLGNLISGNGGDGILITGVTTSGNVVEGNQTQFFVIPGNSGSGVAIMNGATGNTVGGPSSVDSNGNLTGLGNVISGNTNAGVWIQQASGNFVQGNFIGTDSTGKVAVPNDLSGTRFDGVDLLDGATDNVIGGASSRDANSNLSGLGNLISGNGFDGVFIGDQFGGGPATGNIVQGNFIGTDVTGTKKLANQGNGVHLEGGAIRNTIGGTDPRLRNVISGNGDNAALAHTPFGVVGAGVQVADFFDYGPVHDNQIVGNFIGTDATGTQRLGNLYDGVILQQDVFNNRVGPGNVISGNGSHGVTLLGTTTASAPPAGGASVGSLTLTPAGQAAGFTFSTFAAGFPVRSSDNAGPLGIVVPASGGVLVGDALGNVRLFPTDADGQNAANNPPVAGARYNTQVSGMARLGSTLYMAIPANNQVVQINRDGTINHVVATIANANGITADPLTGHLFVSAAFSSAIYEVDPIAKTATVFANLAADGLAFDSTTNTLYVAGYGDPVYDRHIVGFNASTGALVFDSGTVPGQPDGIAIGTGVLAGNLFVNTNAGTLVEVNLASHAQTVVASGGSRGDFVAPDPTNGTLLVTQSNLIARLIPPAGGGFQSSLNTTGNVVQGDYIGTDSSGTQRLGNSSDGVLIEGGASGNRIGGPGQRNVISANGRFGVVIQDPTTANNVVESNYIGTDATGETATDIHGNPLGNALGGVYIQLGAHDNRIGTDGDGINDRAERNVISGNGFEGVTITEANNDVVAGNYIGTDAAGRIALPNFDSGVYVFRSQGNRIGARSGAPDGAGERNVISGNGRAGVTIDGLDARNNVLASNFIGTDADGQAPLANGVGVRLINGANGNTIGGSDPGLGNVISGNTGDGLDFQGNGLPAGAVADYRAEGDASDALGFNNGTIQGNVTFEPGRFGQAFHFDGAPGEGVHIPASSSLNVGSGGGLTLTAWINPDDVSSQEPIIEWTNGVHLWFSTTFGGAKGPGNLYANLQDSQGNAHIISSAPGILQAHQWQFVALTYDKASGVATLYVNGVATQFVISALVAQQNLGSFTPNTTGDVNLGHRVPQSFSGSGQLAGGLDEVGIYNRALSLGEIDDLIAANGLGANNVFGNRIGTALDPSIKLANGGDGVVLDNTLNNLVGGNLYVGAPNVIAGNLGRGVFITGSGSWFNTVEGNFIGTDVTGNVKQGNGSDGVRVSEGARFNFVSGGAASGGGNLIAYNGGHGVVVGNGLNDPSYGNEIEGNRGIFANARIGIDLGNDGVTPNTAPRAGYANDLANFPVITSARTAGGITVITATVHSFPNSFIAFIDFYADANPDPTGYGQGGTLLGTLGNVSTDANGNATVTHSFPVNLSGQYLTATATDSQLSTSEFAQDVAVTPLLPTLTSLSSSTAPEGPLTLTVNGTDFVQGAVVSVNGMPLATTFVSSTQLTAAVPAGLLEEGSASVTVANPAPGGGTSNALSLTVTDAPLNVTGSALTATGSAPFSGVVGTFTDTGGSEPAGSYTALINWGDGSTSPGTVAPAGNGFNVVGSHTYLSASMGSPFTTTVTVADEGGSSASGNGSASVAHAPLTAWGQNAALTEGTSAPVVVAVFSDPDPRDAGSDFTVTINWGDGASSAGTVSPTGGGLLQVSGAHAYGEEGNYLVTVSVQDARGGSAVATASAAVADAPLSATGLTLTVTGNKNFSGIVGMFRDADPAAELSDYTATVTWDDGTSSVATVSGSGTFLVSATHHFGKFKGPHTVVVTVTDAGGASVTMTDVVIDPPGRHRSRHHRGTTGGPPHRSLRHPHA